MRKPKLYVDYGYFENSGAAPVFFAESMRFRKDRVWGVLVKGFDEGDAPQLILTMRGKEAAKEAKAYANRLNAVHTVTSPEVL